MYFVYAGNDYFFQNPALLMSQGVENVRNFSDLGLCPSIVEALKQYDINSPTNIQVTVNFLMLS